MDAITRTQDEDLSTTHSRDDQGLQKATQINAADLERRRVVEKKLKRKLDARCSLFVIIYVMSE
jgi:hypothetical protein